jgi:membrane-associated phospholipid phosphatase
MKMLIALLLLANTCVAQVEPAAGSWKTFVINTKEYRLAPPPDKTKTAAEIKKIRELQTAATPEMVNELLHWNAGAPNYRWLQAISKMNPPGPPPFREMAIFNVAIYDATIAAWDTKYTYKRARPGAGVAKKIDVPDNPSYPCEYSVAAGVAATIFSYLYPEKADSFQAVARKVIESRLISGVQYPSDVTAGFELGKKVAEKVIERSKLDGSDIRWTGSVPTGQGLWNGKRPMGTTYGQRKLWVLDSASQFRPGPPPDFKKDMEELKNFRKTEATNSRAYYFASGDEWTEVTHKKIFEYHLDLNAPMAARVYAVRSIAFHDAIVSCWEAKYHYWGIRPDQFDTTYHATLMTPPFPGYPSGHATTSNASATVLSYFFPGDKKEFEQRAWECAESRFEGGIHFRTDNEVGLVMGKKIGETILARLEKKAP